MKLPKKIRDEWLLVGVIALALGFTITTVIALIDATWWSLIEWLMEKVK